MQENNAIEQMEVTTPSEVEKPLCEQADATNNTLDNEKTEISYGKFKSAQSLLEGYQQLEKEFTKKCQAMKELENQAVINPQVIEKMLNINPKLTSLADELKSATNTEEFCQKLAEQLVGRINEPCNIIKDEEFLNNYVYSNSEIVGRVIADYLDSLATIKAPQTLSKGGSSYVSPTYRPHTIAEAGNMARKFIENRRF